MSQSKRKHSRLWLPQSFFVRMLWLVLITVLFSKALTLGYLLLNEDVMIDRQYSHGAAMLVRAYWSVDDESRDDIAIAAGVLWKADNEAPPSEYHWPYTDIFQRQIESELGSDASIRLLVSRRVSALWVSAPSLGPGWLEIPMYPHPLRGQQIWRVLAWFLGIISLSMFTAGIFVLQLSRPLKRLVFAARQLGQGKSVRLKTTSTPSELTEVYVAFNQMAEDVEQAKKEQELMLAGVSHDLRTPLTRLRLSVELMHNEEFTEDMVRDIEDMNNILDQFIAFIRDGRDEPLEEVDLNELIKETVAPFNQVDERVQLFLEDVPLASLRCVSIKRLLSNLINNALNYSQNRINITTYTTSKDEKPYVVLSVLDRGPGMNEAELKTVFDPFVRGNQARSNGQGSGLGLSIVKRIVDQHHGHIELFNRVGGGLEARVSLPLGLKTVSGDV